MASSYSTDLKLELMVTGENAGTWGDNTNNNLNLIQQAIAGYEAVALSDGGTVALAMTDKTISNARNMVIKFTGTLTSASTVTIPDSIEKFYIFDCSAVTGPTNLTIKTASGTGFTLDRAAIYAAYSDGTNLNEISLDTLGGKVAAAQLTPAGSDKQIQFNDNGSFGAIAIGTCGQVLTSNGTSASFQDVQSAGDAVSWQTGSIKTGDFTAVAGEGYFVNTTSGAVTVTLPAGSAGSLVAIQDYNNTFDTNNCIISPNGSEKINGGTGDIQLGTEGQGVHIIYIDATVGWRVIIGSDDPFANVGTNFIQATGGTETTCGDFKTHTFTGPGTFTVTNTGLGTNCSPNIMDYLVVAGGGSGGSNNANGSGGGGGGGYREAKAACSPTHTQPPHTASPLASTTGLTATIGSFPITIGAGGAGVGENQPGRNGNKGSDSIFSSITATGGGYGGSGVGNGNTGGPGGSGGGGGGGPNNRAGGTGNTPPTSPAQGTNGGNSSAPSPSPLQGGGGGGASEAGVAGQGPNPHQGGRGGAGTETELAPPSVGGPGSGPTYRDFSGGGGAGKSQQAANSQGPGSPCGTGGAGAGNPGLGGNGTTNSGGAGGAGGDSSPKLSGTGGSGAVVIRYKYQ